MALNGERVLIVEDEFLIALDIELTIRGAGAELVLVSTTAEQALTELEGRAITLAVLDINLGAGTSLPVAARLEIEGIPFVFHTARRELSSEWPSAPIVCKPASSSELLAALVAVANTARRHV